MSAARPLSRRDAIARLAMAGVALVVPGACAPPRGGSSTFAPLPSRRLSPLAVSPAHVIRVVAGLRPYRKTGFLVKAEAVGDALLVHNYGHGGGGVSLSWGTARQAAELARASAQRVAAVIGCGVIGLSTARMLQDRGFSVTIYARALPPDTTSNVAGAQWSPYTIIDRDQWTPAFAAQFDDATRFAYRYFQHMVGYRYGVSWRDNYVIGDRPAARSVTPGSARPAPTPLDLLLEELLPRADVPRREHPFGDREVSRFSTMHIEPSIYMTELLADFRAAGGQVVVRDFADHAAILALPERVIVNCTGLAAGQLFGDGDVLPIKGQLVVLEPQDEVDYITLGPGGLYMMPRRDGIVLGGTSERGVWTPEPDPAATTRILEGHRRLFADAAAAR